MSKHSQLDPNDSLETMFPEIAVQWHPTKNGELLPSQVHHGTKKKIWWTGDCGHEWEAQVSSRTRTGVGCSYCSGRYCLKNFNCLQSQKPAVAVYWCHELNGGLKPDMVTASSAKRVHWKCEEGHTWTKQVCDQVRAKNPCAMCSQSSHTVTIGVNDLASKYPLLAKEWHPTKNTLKPTEVRGYSKKVVWWKGRCGHEWEGKIVHRAKATSDSGGCPYCCGKKVDGTNSLAAISPETASLWNQDKNVSVTPHDITASSDKIFWWKCLEGHDWECNVISQINRESECPVCTCRPGYIQAGVNDIKTTHPELIKELHPTKNEELDLDTIGYTTHRKVWWLGACGHEWEAILASRATQNYGCNVCAGRVVVSGVNNIKSTHPHLAQEFHRTKNLPLTVETTLAGTNQRLWWKCLERGHEWFATGNSRALKGYGCPYCSGFMIEPNWNCLQALWPSVSAEWHPTKNEGVLPNTISPGSAKLFWWQCAKGHEWQARPGNRTANQSGCPTCQNHTYTSKIELALCLELTKTYPDAENGTRLPIKWNKALHSNLDIFIPSINTIVEYDGSYWHRDKFDHDTMKSQALIDAGYTVVRVRHHPLPFLPMTNPKLIQIAHHDESAEDLAQLVLNEFNQ